MSEKVFSTAAPPCPVCGKGHLLFFPHYDMRKTDAYVCSSPQCNYQITRSKKISEIYKLNF